jgi:hypothetical protein
MLSKKTWKAPSAWPNSVLTFYSQKEKETERERERRKKKIYFYVCRTSIQCTRNQAGEIERPRSLRAFILKNK